MIKEKHPSALPVGGCLTYEEVEIIDPQIGKIISKEDYEKFRLQ